MGLFFEQNRLELQTYLGRAGRPSHRKKNCGMGVPPVLGVYSRRLDVVGDYRLK
jgi:hypothetical protein